MRKVVLSFAAAAAVVALSTPGSATDFGAGGYSALGQRAGQIVVYDFQPGVLVRPYWAPPWRNRHYFPVTGTIPDSGRHEDLNAPRRRYPPAQGYYREWSSSSVFELQVVDFAQGGPLAAGPGPVDEPPAEALPGQPERRFEPLDPETK
ncbi:MAG: hypothetical protein AB7E67_16950 [Xanthobacteraceae bacterium]